MRSVAFVAKSIVAVSVLAVSVLAVSVLAVSVVSSGAARAAPCWRPPVSGTVIDPFRPPPCPWCAGNRGIEYRTAVGGAVRSVAAGRVTFSGSVAGTRYVVVEIADGWRLTYGRLASTQLRSGDAVASRAVIGTSSGELYFGLRIGGVYRDPAAFLGQWTGRPRLVPVDGSAGRDVAPRWRCGV